MPARRLAGQLRRARCANARIMLQHGQIRNGVRFYSILSGELTIRLVFIRAFTLVPILGLLVSYLVCHMVFQAHSTSRLIGKYLYNASNPNMSGAGHKSYPYTEALRRDDTFHHPLRLRPERIRWCDLPLQGIQLARILSMCPPFGWLRCR